MHKGVSEYAIDIATAGKKVDVYAVADGIVETAGTMVKNKEGKVVTVDYGSGLNGLEMAGFGNYVVINHNMAIKACMLIYQK